MKKNIIVTLQIAGLHSWNRAKNYLQHEHRHIFYIVAKKEVSHNDRDIEFIQLKQDIYQGLLTSFYDLDKQVCDFGLLSCEGIAEGLLKIHELNYCSVMEDNENGAEVFI